MTDVSEQNFFNLVRTSLFIVLVVPLVFLFPPVVYGQNGDDGGGDGDGSGVTLETLFGGLIERAWECRCLSWDDLPWPNPWDPQFDDEGMKYKGRMLHIGEPDPGRVMVIRSDLTSITGVVLDALVGTRVYRHGRNTHRVGHWTLGRNWPGPEFACRSTNWWQSARRSLQVLGCQILGGDCARPPWVRICRSPRGGDEEDLQNAFPARIIGSGLCPDFESLNEIEPTWGISAEGMIDTIRNVSAECTI